MVVQCDSCGAKFHVNDRLISPIGTTVRCSKCKTVFKAFRPENEESKPELLKSSSNVAAAEEFEPSEEVVAEKASDADLGSSLFGDLEEDFYEEEKPSAAQLAEALRQGTPPPIFGAPEDEPSVEEVTESGEISQVNEDEIAFPEELEVADEAEPMANGASVSDSTDEQSDDDGWLEDVAEEEPFDEPSKPDAVTIGRIKTEKLGVVLSREMAQQSSMPQDPFAEVQEEGSDWLKHAFHYIALPLLIVFTVVVAFHFKGVALWKRGEISLFFKQGFASKASGVVLVDYNGFQLDRLHGEPIFVVEGTLFNKSTSPEKPPKLTLILDPDTDTEQEFSFPCCLELPLKELRTLESAAELRFLYDEKLNSTPMPADYQRQFLLVLPQIPPSERYRVVAASNES